VEEEVEGMGEEDLEEYPVVEESIESARCEEEEVHRTVEDLFESLREDRVSVWLRATNKGMKEAASLQITGSRSDDAIREGSMSVAARRKAT
jgi:ferritin-like metal-binding protein YciE